MNKNSVIMSESAWCELGKSIMHLSLVDAFIRIIDHVHIVGDDKFDDISSMLSQKAIAEDKLSDLYYGR